MSNVVIIGAGAAGLMAAYAAGTAGHRVHIMESNEKADNAIIRHPFDSYGIDRDSTYFYFDSVNFVGPLQRF